MDRRDFFGAIGKILMVGAVTVVAPEILTPEPVVEMKPWTLTTEQQEIFDRISNSKPDWTLAS
jgi:hypothetical protein